MQLMAELSGEQGSSADLLRRLEQAESKTAALEAKVQVLIRHGCFVALSDHRQTDCRSKPRAHGYYSVMCGLTIESGSKGRQHEHVAAACRRRREANGSSHIWWGTCSGHAKRLLWLPSRPLH